MNHNDFDFCEDLITPFYHFLTQMGLSTREPKSAYSQMTVPDKYFKIPKAYLQNSIKMKWGCCYVSVNNHQNPISDGDSVANPNNSYFQVGEQNTIGAPQETDVENTETQQNKTSFQETDDLEMPIVLEHVDNSLATPHSKIAQVRNSILVA